jgi:adenylate cyclase
MPVEIERKFLVIGEGWRNRGRAERIRQGYLVAQPGLSVRIRRAGSRAFITVKSGAAGPTRAEYEYDIPPEHADEMLETLCSRPVIEKWRHTVDVGGAVWTIDEFRGALAGLVLAEIELDHPDQPVDLPDWIGAEVTGDPHYLNANLAKAGRAPRPA